MLMRIRPRLALVLLLSHPFAAAAAQPPATGIGIQIEHASGGTRIAAVVAGSPAEQAGLRAGDLIVAVNDLPIAAFADPVIVSMIRGVAGSTVRLVVSSPNGNRRTLTIARSVAIPASAAATQGAPARPLPPPVASSPTPPATPTAAMPAGSSESPVAFVRWTEAKEHSFSVDVPRGWNVTGGLGWSGPIDPQMSLHAQSPDGAIDIFLGDPEILPRQVPNGFSGMQTGVREGGVFKAPSGGRALLARFQTGTEFAKYQVGLRHCRNAQWVSANELPDMARSVNEALQPEAQRWHAQFRVSAGDVGFTCDTRQGYAMAVTFLAWSASGPTQVWGVQGVGVFLSADPMRSMQARYILEHMLATKQNEPQWEQAYEQRVMQLTGAVISMQNAALQAQMSAARSASDTLSRMNHPNAGVNVRPGERRASSVNTTLGTRDVCDAVGRCKSVSNDADTYFMDHSGNVVPGRAGGAPPDNSGVWSPTYTR